ncbi:DUF3553 domain-containing protein [bacterium]|nr:DUF3553 domain-containing protein [bacterium]
MGSNGFRLYLRLHDIVTHRDYRQWGEGRVVEEMTSTVPGGTCLVRVQFQDGRLRTFNNDLDAQACCYYFGVRKQWDGAAALFGAAAPAKRPALAEPGAPRRRRARRE